MSRGVDDHATLALLLGVERLLSDPDRYHSGFYVAVTGTGRGCQATSALARRWTVVGALLRVAWPVEDEGLRGALRRLREASPSGSVLMAGERGPTWEEAMETVRRAVAVELEAALARPAGEREEAGR